MLEDVKKDANERMNKCVAALKNELKKVRTGRAHTSLLEHIRVEYYGNEVPLNQVANLAVGLRQVVVGNRRPEMVRRVVVHVARRDEEAF